MWDIGGAFAGACGFVTGFKAANFVNNSEDSISAKMARGLFSGVSFLASKGASLIASKIDILPTMSDNSLKKGQEFLSNPYLWGFVGLACGCAAAFYWIYNRKPEAIRNKINTYISLCEKVNLAETILNLQPSSL